MGDVIELVKLVTGMEFKECVDWLKPGTFEKLTDSRGRITDRPTMPLVRHSQTTNPPIKSDNPEGNEFSGIYDRFIESLPEAAPGGYLDVVRGISPDVIREARIRKVPSDRTGENPTANKTAAGLFPISKKTNKPYFAFFACEYVTPFYSPEGNISYLQGIGNKQSRERGNKTVNLSGIKKQLIYLPYQFFSYKPGDTVFIVEGVIDCLSIITIAKAHGGNFGAVAVIDAGLKGDFSELDILKPFKVVLMGDSDSPGVKAMEALFIYMLNNGFQSVRVYSVGAMADTLGIPGGEGLKDANNLLLELRRSRPAHFKYPGWGKWPIG